VGDPRMVAEKPLAGNQPPHRRGASLPGAPADVAVLFTKKTYGRVLAPASVRSIPACPKM
jgi:hypothetical protein